ncbi:MULTISPECIES: GOLPH3/VPS74 family protein [Streptomyces]|uniref:GPP34 family phosphoprotein n=2 Tax=Streptomyces TaxID=1883 RepID=A0A367EFX2_9ACTN|nr:MULTISPECIES: GPP34 family phosphoprotein [Streptomyces]RCG16257.1 GPP34 family phosphoprotein [Streptomyces diacarni]RCG24606.1 GPP34 family phosphoprotein [Streptomyces reniochalinae]
MEQIPGSLPRRLFLLACDVEKERLKWGDELGYAIRAATLAELEARACLKDDRGKARPVGGGRRTGDPVLDGALRSVEGHSRARRWHTLVQKERRETCLAVESDLVGAGLISVASRTLRRKEITVRDKRLPGLLRAEAVATLTGSDPVDRVEPSRAALASFAALARLCPELSWGVRHRNRRRLKELTARAGVAGPALKKALDARTAAASGASAGG